MNNRRAQNIIHLLKDLYIVHIQHNLSFNLSKSRHMWGWAKQNTHRT